MKPEPREKTLQPDWDMSPYFAGVDKPEYRNYFASLQSDLDSLAKRLSASKALTDESVSSWATLLCDLEEVSARTTHLVSYLECLGAANSLDEAVKRESSNLARSNAQQSKLFVRARAALGSCDSEIFGALVESEKLQGARHFLTRLREHATKSMSEDLEGLQADLGVDGIGAWGRLYDQVAGTLEFSLELPEQPQKRRPVALTRSLLEDADPVVRKAAFDGSAKAWEQVSDTLAAALNAIAGTRHTLYERRGVSHYLQPALFDAGITRDTLECMMQVVRSRQSLPQDYLRSKAAHLGKTSLGFCDLMAPFPVGERNQDHRVRWEEGARQVQAAFDASYPALGALAKRAFQERWIDYTPRPAKRPGGFCSTSPVNQQSRIFMTFNGGMGDVQTLAHELGHTFHSYLMRDMRPWSADYPMTLAETASTFAENVVTSAALRDASSSTERKLTLLDRRLSDSASFLLNIPMRFDFECAFYEARKQGEVSVAALKEMMINAQKQNYGSSLNPDQLDPWFWASKLHFYITEISFYNFPYTFGYLFSLGLFARFAAEGQDFLPRYEKLLRETGSAPAETVAQNSLGVDLQSPEFWNASIDLIESDWRSFQALLS